MLTRFSDFSDWPSFGFADFGRANAHGQLRRELDRLLGDFERGSAAQSPAAVSFDDDGSDFVLRADVPGLTEKDFEISVAGDTLTLRGERKLEVPDGHSVHQLPARVDAEKAVASLKHGVLTLRLPKVAEAQPRQISVTAA
jgi:HSP20 family protein